MSEYNPTQPPLDYALGVAVPRPDGNPVTEIALMQRLSNALYAGARTLRDNDQPIAASAVEWGAFHLVNEAEGLRATMEARKTT